VAIGLLVLNSFLTVPVRAKFAVAARDLVDSMSSDTARIRDSDLNGPMTAKSRTAETVPPEKGVTAGFDPIVTQRIQTNPLRTSGPVNSPQGPGRARP
jgi:hypothetical protein